MIVLITGATGLIGSEIVRQCHERGWIVHYLSRSEDKLSNEDNYKGFLWNVEEKTIDKSCFDGVELIINLAGATIAKRWTDDYKKVIVQSRVDSLNLLRSAVNEENNELKQIISASAIGIYDDSLTNYYNESSQLHSDSFLGKTVEKWERAVDEFSDLGLKVSKIRIGLVLSDKGGALEQIIKPTKFGMGASMGNGEQWQSWIHIEDLAKIFVHIADNHLEGTYNGVAPNPVINETLTKEIAAVLGKPLILPNVPKIMMKLVLGEMHILLFESQRVSSEKLETTGFNFKYPNLKPALSDLLA